MQYGSKTGEDFRREVELPFFREHLKDGPPTRLPKALMFETGGNRWHRCDAWPPTGVTPMRLFLGRTRHTLVIERRAARPYRGSTSTVSDPRKPVPYTSEIIVTEGRRWTVEDQRFVATRPDVLVYSSEPLTEDVTIAGPFAVELFASTSGTDADWVVKLIDVFPDDAKDPSPNPLNLKMARLPDASRRRYSARQVPPGFEKAEPMTPVPAHPHRIRPAATAITPSCRGTGS